MVRKGKPGSSDHDSCTPGSASALAFRRLTILSRKYITDFDVK